MEMKIGPYEIKVETDLEEKVEFSKLSIRVIDGVILFTNLLPDKHFHTAVEQWVVVATVETRK
jgi:hypothetical protein